MSASLEPTEEVLVAAPSISDAHQDHPTSIDWRILLGFVSVGLYLYFAY